MSYISELNTAHVDYCKHIAEQLSKNLDLFNDIEDRVWSIAKQYDTMPDERDFVGFYVDEVHKELENQILERIRNMDVDINIRYEGVSDSKFYINDNRILNLKDVENAIAKAIQEANEADTEIEDDYSAVEEIRAELESRKEQKDRRLR